MQIAKIKYVDISLPPLSSTNMKTEEEREEFIDLVDFYTISKNKNMTIEFIDKYHEGFVC